jgi:hypothetical protein
LQQLTEIKDKAKKEKKLKMDSNMQAVFLHYLGDALSSIFVLISGLLLRFSSGRWLIYIDPVARLVDFIVVGKELLNAIYLLQLDNCWIDFGYHSPTGEEMQYDSFTKCPFRIRL